MRQPGETMACPSQVHSMEFDRAVQIARARPRSALAQPISREIILPLGQHSATPSAAKLAMSSPETIKAGLKRIVFAVPRIGHLLGIDRYDLGPSLLRRGSQR